MGTLKLLLSSFFYDQNSATFETSNSEISEEDKKDAKCYNGPTAEVGINEEHRNEERIKVSPQKHSLSSSIGILYTKFGKETFYGTGILVKNSSNSSMRILTCAHNVVQGIQHGWKKAAFADAGLFYPGCTRDRKPIECKIAKVTKSHIFPGYGDSPTPTGGSDLALLEFTVNKGNPSDLEEKIHDAVWDCYRMKDELRLVRVMGYPNDPGKADDPYEMCGTIHSVDLQKRIIIYKDIQTSGGQSGSPVLVMRDTCWVVIGIHTGWDRNRNGKIHIATMLTGANFSWIEKEMNKS